MFTKKVTDSDDFIALPASAQAMYLHLNQGADDDGFNNQVQMAMWKAHASIDDLKLLISKRFLLTFESGVIVIKHWRMHNTLRKDRFTPTNFQEELKMLGIKKNLSYTLDMSQAEWLPDGCQLVVTGKVSIGKLSKGKGSVVEGSNTATATAIPFDEEEDEEDDPEYDEKIENTFHVWEGSLGRGVVILTEKQVGALLDKLGLEGFDYYVSKLADFIIEKEAKVANHYATILKWAREDAKV
jgi:hypothetical protein